MSSDCGQIITFYVTALALKACVVMTHQYGEDDNQDIIYLKMIPAMPFVWLEVFTKYDAADASF